MPRARRKPSTVTRSSRARPSPVTTGKRSAPCARFLSLATKGHDAASSPASTRVGKPKRRQQRLGALQQPRGVQPSVCVARSSATVPSATASPWSQREYPPWASRAWPTVCPRLRSARRPASRSSSRTTRIFASMAARTTGPSAPCSPRASAGGVAFEAREQGGVGGEGDLHDLGEPAEPLARGERVQVSQVGHHRARLVERADEVLAGGMIEAVLPPTDASTIASSVVGTCTKRTPRSRHAAAKPGEVADDAAAGRDDERVAIDARPERGVPDGRRRSRASCGARPAAA